MVTKKEDWTTPSLAKLLESFKDLPNFEGFIKAVSNQHELLDCRVSEVYNSRDIDIATGAQLDLLGNLLGAPRGSLSDAAYRVVVRAQSVVNTSDGTLPTIAKVLNALYQDPTAFNISNDPGASNLVVTTEQAPPSGISPQRIIEMLCDTISGGVNLQYIYLNSAADPFRFAGGALPGLGFSNSATPLVGGEFAGLESTAQACDRTTDVSPPFVLITAPSSPIDIAGSPNSIVYTVEFTDRWGIQPHTFTPADITLTGTLTPFLLGATTITGTNPYTVTIDDPTFSGASTGDLVFSVNAGTVQDGNGISNLATSAPQITVTDSADAVLPVATITSVVTPIEAGVAPQWTVLYTDNIGLEPTPTLTPADITITGVALDTIVGTNPFTVTGQATTTLTDCTLKVLAGAVQDLAGNFNIETAVDTITIQDTIAPVANFTFEPGLSQLAVDVASPQAVWTVLFTDLVGVTSSSPVFSVSPGGAGGTTSIASVPTANPHEYTVTVSGLDFAGEVGIRVAAGGAQDASANSSIQQDSATVTCTATPFVMSATLNGGSDLDPTGGVSIQYDYVGPVQGGDFTSLTGTQSFTVGGTAVWTTGPFTSYTGFPGFGFVTVTGTITTVGTVNVQIDSNAVGSAPTITGTYRQGFATFTTPDAILALPSTDFSTFVGNNLIIGGTTQTREWAYAGTDATATTWPANSGAGGTLNLSTVSVQNPNLIQTDTPVQGMSAVYQGVDTWHEKAGSQSIMDVAIGDGFLIEAVFQAGVQEYLATSAANTGTEGIIFRTTSRFVMNVRDGSGNAVQALSGTNPVDGQWYYMLFGMDRNGNYAFYTSATGGLDGSGAHGIVDAVTGSNSRFLLGGASASVEAQEGLGYISMYTSATLDLTSTVDFVAAGDARYAELGMTVGVEMLSDVGFANFDAESFMHRGTILTPTLAYTANDVTAGGTTWPAATGPLMNLTGGITTKGVEFGIDYVETPVNEWFEAVSTAMDLTSTEGCLIECIYKTNGSVTQVLLGSKSGTGDGIRVVNQISTNSRDFVTHFRDTGASSYINNSGDAVQGEWNYMVIGFDRAGNALVYDSKGGSVTTSVHTLTANAITSALGEVYLMGASAGTDHFGRIAYASFYKGTGLSFTSADNFKAACNRRFYLLGQTPGSIFS